MKKRLSKILTVVLLGLSLTALTACDFETTKTITSKNTQEIAGNHAVFQTTDVQKYLNFLDNFDETKYCIVDISNCMYGSSDVTGYMVTYKTIE